MIHRIFQSWVAKTLCLLTTCSVAVFAAPAPDPLRPVPAPPTLLAPPDPNVNLSSLVNDGTSSGNGTLGGIEQWQYQIPKTTLLLRMAAYPPHKIDRRALGQTILVAQTRVRTHLNEYGDAELWDEDDPFQTDHLRTGKCFIGIASSATVPSAAFAIKLNYSTVATVLEALWQVLYLGRRECEVVFKVEDRARERRREGEEVVGLGKVLGGNSPF